MRVNGSRCKHDIRLKEGDIIRIPPHNLEKKNLFLPSNSLADILKKNIRSFLINIKPFSVQNKKITMIVELGIEFKRIMCCLRNIQN